MHPDESSFVVAEVIPELKGMPQFERGRDFLTLSILKRMKDNPDKLFSVYDFHGLGNLRRIRSSLEILVKQKFIKKLNSYPRFYHVIL